ncbi:MAG: hypothetical protein U0694_26385 [Anaerolineae bacterium]
MVGTLTATDPDAGETFTFSGGDAQFTVSGNQVTVAGGLAAGAQSLNVTVTDSAGNPYSETITINVTAVTQPPTGTFVFVSDGNLYRADYDGTNVVNVTPIASGGVSNPVWTPSSGYVAYVSGGSLYVMDPNNTGSIMQIVDSGTGTPISGFTPTWVDDDTLLFGSTQSGAAQIYTMDVNVSNGQASNIVQLTTDGVNYSPSRSPVDGRIAFVSERNGEVAQIYVMNGDGTGQTKVSTDNTHAQNDPAWSPNGQYIAFVFDWGGGDQDIIRMNASNPSDAPNLTGSSTQAETNPGWSPDSSRIIYQQNGTTYIMNVDGSGATPISTGTAQTIDPTWHP